MSPSSRRPAAVIIAVADAGPGVARSLAAFAAEVDAFGPGAELVVVASGSMPAALPPRARLIQRPAGRLVPELWRDGIDATSADRVALSVATMVPTPGWLAALNQRLDAAGASGVGGPIAPGLGLSPTDRAVALLRYASYWPDRSDPPANQGPPGDNALYRRDRLDRVRDAWADGFWENDVHKALRGLGDTLALAGADGSVTFQGGTPLRAMLGARWRHGHIYGRGRAGGAGLLGRVARTARAPLVPPLLAARIGAELRRRQIPVGPWLRAGPALAALASAWALGEAAGAWAKGPGSGTRGGCIQAQA